MPIRATATSNAHATGAALPGCSGTYIVLLEVSRPRRLRIGRLGTFELPPGLYAYVGSAFGAGGLAARVGRHLRIAAHRHWHVDYVRAAASPVAVFWYAGPAVLEHRWSAVLARLCGAPPPVPGFGASDCRCGAHLYRLPADHPHGRLAAALAGVAGSPAVQLTLVGGSASRHGTVTMQSANRPARSRTHPR
ncbi:MAG: GIY-YIG nuclease family protein [Gammaproteobacteria bacterium]|nr:GIY-YIG nuclease family protein [Gammaproteobacteria bacterium]